MSTNAVIVKYLFCGMFDAHAKFQLAVISIENVLQIELVATETPSIVDINRVPQFTSEFLIMTQPTIEYAASNI